MKQPREIVLWAPPGREPKALAQGATAGPGPGPVFAVQAGGAREAREKLRSWRKLRAKWEALGAEGRSVLEQERPLLGQVREVTSA